VTEGQGTRCPECGTPRRPDNTPSCTCTARASEALRELRTAEAAAAEDFDRLRIRPYVEMRPAAAEPPAAPVTGVPLPPEIPAPPAAAVEPGAPRADDGAVRLRRRSRRTALLAAGGAGVAVVAVAGAVLFSYRAPARDQAAAQEVRAGVPETTDPALVPGPPLSSTSAPPTGGPSPSRSSASPPPMTPTASVSTPATTASPTVPATPSVTPGTTPAVLTVLRRGDTGPKVVDLQQRLARVHLYAGRPDGVFSHRVEMAVRGYQLFRGIKGDVLGTYGPATRASLEARTARP
jgi:hypothetical protein